MGAVIETKHSKTGKYTGLLALGCATVLLAAVWAGGVAQAQFAMVPSPLLNTPAASEAATDADYIVVELAKHLHGEDWLPKYVAAANAGGIERVLV